MTRIDFYQITGRSHNPDSLVCKLCHKAYQQHKKVLLLTANSEQTERLDRLLWTNQDESFLPHDQQEQQGFITPILLNHQAAPMGERDFLINLSDDVPTYFAQFERVFELVTEQNKTTARSHYSYYKDRGYELNHHHL